MSDPVEVIAKGMADAIFAEVGGTRVGNVVHTTVRGIDADELARAALAALEAEGFSVVPTCSVTIITKPGGLYEVRQIGDSEQGTAFTPDPRP